jgi:hypothetical protein
VVTTGAKDQPITWLRVRYIVPLAGLELCHIQMVQWSLAVMNLFDVIFVVFFILKLYEIPPFGEKTWWFVCWPLAVSFLIHIIERWTE